MEEPVKPLTAEDTATAEMLAASMNNIVKKYNSILSGTALAKDLNQVKADLIIETKNIAQQLEKGGEDFGKLKHAFDGLMDVIKIQGESITTLKTAFDPKLQRKSFRDMVYENLTKGAFKDISEQKSSRAKFEIETKDLAFGTVGGFGSGDAGAAYRPFDTPYLPPAENFDIRLVVPTGTIDTMKLEFPQERAASLTNSIASAAENGNAAESSIGFVNTAVTAKRITTFIEVSRSALKNSAWLSNYISNRLMQFFVAELNEQVIAGAGGGVDDIHGLFDEANTAAFVHFAGQCPDGNKMDVLNFAAGEMEHLYNITPNTIFMNPVDSRILASSKNTLADFINPGTFLLPNNMGYQTIFGMKPINAKDVTVDSYLVAAIAPQYMQLLFCGPIEILATDSHASNFIADLVAIKIEAMVMLPIYNSNALLKGTLTADLATVKGGI
jgi:hypothetical protein